MRKKLEVTAHEMLMLREQGYSNKEIAEQLECSYATVFNYIGKQGVRKQRTAEKPCSPPVSKPSVEIISQTISIDGYLFNIDHKGKSVDVATGDDSYIRVRVEDLDRFVTAFETARQFAYEGVRGNGNKQ